ncbi:hypothetical protein BCR44DRAFT_47140 [Catenaria anguillulae PL171]|uniref:Uncharacterized protein n=1 Tax=Catenaria anguillulae PL171 TaxID=765915 RepID=A0A1Y2HD10_9FUNG|nr:hypothetical protein BCR44DRAFT_47140 [Catenaria anguillulae PL171]
MRPDAHKQKASRRYQATHDMTAGGGRGGSTPKRGRGGSSSLPTTTSARRAQQQETSAQENDAQDNPFAEELESDQSKASAFWTRRRVVDNSFRFEGDLPATSDDDADADADADENVPDRGQDAGAKAAKLLAERIARTEQRSRTDAGAFKFKDEEAWDQARESAGGPNADLDAVAMLDLNQLDTCLASVPLATRIPAVTAFIANAKTASPVKVSAFSKRSGFTFQVSLSLSVKNPRFKGAAQPAPAQGSHVANPTQITPADKKPAEVSKVASMEAWLDDFLDD